MAKRALLIGSQTAGLSGAESDAEAVADLLQHLGFTTDLCIGKNATRQGILGRYERLIADAVEGDTIAIYYSGHGGLAANPNYRPLVAEGISEPQYYQFIVPTDMNETSEGDFRGITSLELSVLLAKLTGKTKNVTVVLDCCHAARMSRDPDLTPKALPRPWFAGVASHLDKLGAEGILTTHVHVESNPDAVRLVAAGPNESAYEYTNATGQPIGMLTESFLIAMKEAQGQKVSWHNIGTRVRRRVLSMTPIQRPEVEGPADRLLFELETVEQTGVLPVMLHGSVAELQGGRLLGISVGDKYAIAPMGVEKPTSENEIATATVTQVAGGSSKLDVEFRPGHTDIPSGANAFPVSTTLPKLAVKIKATGEKEILIRKAIEASQHVRVAADDDPADVLAEVVVAEEKIDLRDRSGLSMLEPKPFSEEAISLTVTNLDKFAQVQTLLELRSGEGPNKLNIPYKIEWGRVVDGKPQPSAESGALLFDGDRVYIRIANHGEGWKDKLYVSVFDVGLSGKVALLTASEPSGVEILPQREYVLGHREYEGLVGLKLGWPKTGVPRDTVRTESLIVIVSDAPQDLRALEQKEMRDVPLGMSSLQKVLGQIMQGAKRDVEPDAHIADVRYSVNHISFLLNPSPAPFQDKGQFLIDDRPEPSFLLLTPRGAAKPPATIAIRLKDLVVHRNRALFGTEVRVDTMVVTGPTEGQEGKFYKVETFPFTGVKNGDRLSFDNLLIYHGPVAHFLDMAIWVSREQKDSLTLAEMFKTELNSDEFKAAATALAGLTVAAPQAALVVGAVGASAILINIGAKLLLQATGKSIGLYRTSHLAHERFGLGLHPTRGLMSVQDFSFRYEIVKVR